MIIFFCLGAVLLALTAWVEGWFTHHCPNCFGPFFDYLTKDGDHADWCPWHRRWVR